MTDEVKNEETNKPEQPQQIMVQDIINNYPIDRERVRDTLFINISTSLNRIANALEYFVSQDTADRKAKYIEKK
jgi:hypothetical protein